MEAGVKLEVVGVLGYVDMCEVREADVTGQGDYP
jgi:hypothetical protein